MSARQVMERARLAWEDFQVDWLEALTVFALVLLLVTGVVSLIAEAREWERFAAEHNCVVIGHMSASTSTGVGTTFVNGQAGVGTVVTTTPAKTGYRCDDGLEYWR